MNGRKNSKTLWIRNSKHINPILFCFWYSNYFHPIALAISTVSNKLINMKRTKFRTENQAFNLLVFPYFVWFNFVFSFQFEIRHIKQHNHSELKRLPPWLALDLLKCLTKEIYNIGVYWGSSCNCVDKWGFFAQLCKKPILNVDSLLRLR